MTKAETLAARPTLFMREMREGRIPPHQIRARRLLWPCDEFLLSFEGEDPVWVQREDALLAGINPAAFEARPAEEVAEAYKRFSEDTEATVTPGAEFFRQQRFLRIGSCQAGEVFVLKRVSRRTGF